MSSMVEVVGVLSMHPSLAPLTYEDTEDQREMDTIAERKVHRPPPSLVPRLHAITATLLTHSNPLLPLNLPSPISLSSNTKKNYYFFLSSNNYFYFNAMQLLENYFLWMEVWVVAEL